MFRVIGAVGKAKRYAKLRARSRRRKEYGTDIDYRVMSITLLSSNAKAVIVATALSMVSLARAELRGLSPVDTGAMRDSIDSGRLVVGPTVDYARYTEQRYGWIRRALSSISAKLRIKRAAVNIYLVVISARDINRRFTVTVPFNIDMSKQIKAAKLGTNIIFGVLTKVKPLARYQIISRIRLSTRL